MCITYYTMQDKYGGMLVCENNKSKVPLFLIIFKLYVYNNINNIYIILYADIKLQCDFIKKIMNVVKS
jgi:hypothetical protein